MRIRNSTLALLPLLLSVSLVAGCDSADDPAGRVVVRMTDAPVENASQINVTIASCEVIDSVTGARETIPSTDEAKLFNLLEYQEGVTLDVCVQDVALASFDQLRVVVGEDAEIVIGEGDAAVSFDLQVASGSSSGLKFFFEDPVSLNGETLDVTLDFAAEESVHTTGPPSSPTGYVMTPVIRVVTATLGGEEELLVEEDPAPVDVP